MNVKLATTGFLVLCTGCSGGGHHQHSTHQHTAHEHSTHKHHKHHHGHHRFQDPEKWAPVFESKERDLWQKPEAVISKLALNPDGKAAEIGSATGYFIVRIAQRLKQGKAYGIDIEQGMVDYLARRAKKEGLPQLVSVLGVPDDPRIPEPVDLIFVCNTYHHIETRTPYFGGLKGNLRPGGRLVIVDFKMGKLPVGPPEAMRITPAKLHRELSAAGYRRVELDVDTLPHQYIAIYAVGA